VVEQQQQLSTSSVSELEDNLEDSEEEDEPEIVEPPSPGALAGHLTMHTKWWST